MLSASGQIGECDTRFYISHKATAKMSIVRPDPSPCAGSESLLELSFVSMFLPYANFWYDNRFAFDVPNEVFDQTDRLEFIARPDQVRAI